MIFNELIYPIFLIISVLVFYLIPVSFRFGWLLISGIIFYTYYAGIFTLLFITQLTAIFLPRKNFKQDFKAFLFCLVACVGILAYFKYRNMALISTATILNFLTDSPIPSFEKILLPLGISFFTFEFIHYVVDVHQGKISRHSFQEFAGFIMFFPTLVAGPIKTFQNFVPQVEAARFDWDNLRIGLSRILIGAGKKIIIADSMNLWVQPLQSQAEILTANRLELWIALFAYSLKIYADFSGYSDIAIGSARLFGIVVPENFQAPYLQANIAQFWRHWHISLTQWIIAYVYIPLGGSRRRLSRVLFNTLVAMGVSGIWHGAEWHFVLWGLYHGILLSGYRLYHEKVKPLFSALPNLHLLWSPLAIGLTFLLVTLGWGLFTLSVPDFLTLVPRLFFPALTL